MAMEHDLDRLKEAIVAALTAEHWGEALPLLEEWCERYPDHARSWLNRGYCLYHLGQFSDAVGAFDTCLELDPESSTAGAWRLRALQELDAGHTISQQHERAPAGLPGAATAGASGATQRAADDTQSPPSFATMGIPEARRDWQAGSVVDGRYEVQALARGGMAVVAIAFDRDLHRTVAIKTPLPSVLASADGGARFQREAESWIALGVHPNICCAYYLQDIGGMPRLFIEYVDGGDLNQWLKRQEQPDLEDRLDIAIQIASGLDYTHTFEWTDDDGIEHQGLVHRDIKPANVLMTRDGIARVTDFGLVRAEGVEEDATNDVRAALDLLQPETNRRGDDSVVSGTWQTVTVEGGLVGTPPYMAPELWRQALRGTIASDIYAYGCMLYEIFCGRRPFVMGSGPLAKTREAHLGGWMRMHLRDDPPDPRSFDEGLQPRLAALMRACIAKDVGRRPQSFGLLRGWLVEIYEEVAGRPYPRPEPKRTQLLADSLNNRGASFVTLGLADRASAAFEEALAVDPRHLEATFNAGLLEWRRSGLTDAELERRLSEAERAAGAGSAGLLRARLRLLLDDPAGALAALGALPEGEREGLASRRERGLALLASARSTDDREELSSARELIRSVIVDSPSDLTSIIGFAECCRRLNDAEVAAEAYAAARSIDRNLPEELDEAVVAHLPGHHRVSTMEHSAPVQNLLRLADGRVVARTGSTEALIWDAVGAEVEQRLDLGGSARSRSSMTAVGGSLVVCVENEPLTVFDLATGDRSRVFRTHPGVVTCVAASPDGTTVASGSSDRVVRLWDFASGECRASLEGHEAFVSALAWHPSGSHLVSASADGTLRTWDLARGRTDHVLSGHRGPVRAVCLDRGGRYALSAGEDGSIGLWRLDTGTLVRFQRGHRGVVTCLVVAGPTIAAGGEDGTVRLWDFTSGEAARVFRMPNPIQDAVVSGDGRHLLAGYGSSVARLLLSTEMASRLPLVLADTAASSELAGREKEFQGYLDDATVLIERGEMEEALVPLRAARALEGYELHDKALELWSRVLAYYPKHAPRSVIELRRLGSGQVEYNACALTPDGGGCVAGCGDGTLRCFDTETGAERFSVNAHEQSVLSVAASGDGLWLATAGRDGAVRVWDAADGRGEREFDGHGGSAQAVVFTPDSRTIVSGGDDGTVRAWPLDEGALPELLGGSGDAISALAVSADGRYVAAGGWDNQVTVWSLRQKAELRRLEGHQGTVHSVAINPECRLVASAAEDGTVRLWDLESGRCWRILRGHEGAVLSVAFTPDGRFVLSAGKDATIRLWDVRTGTTSTTVEGHAGPVGGVDIAGDGGIALTAGSDASLRLWFLDWEPELPERGTWDDRVQPFLKVFIRQRENELPSGTVPKWDEQHLEHLLNDLERRGYGWLAAEKVERELEKLVQFRGESRTEERQRTEELARHHQRETQMAPVKDAVSRLTQNIGLKVAGVALAVVVVLLALMSLRTPDNGVEFSRLKREVSLLVQARGMRLDRGTVLSYQSKPSIGTLDCSQGHFPDFVDLAVDAERMHSPPLDPGVAAEDEGFRVRYANAVNCVGLFGTFELTDRVLQRAAQGLHPYRLEDLLGVLIRIKAADNPRFYDGLYDGSETVRHLVALTLVYSGDDEAIDALMTALDGEERRGVEAASYVLTELVAIGAIREREAFERVRSLISNIDPKVRRNAARGLVLFRYEGAAREVMRDALEDSEPLVVEAAERTRDMMRDARVTDYFD
jgi:WD40 repeat protein/serine/threonine protein kinase